MKYLITILCLFFIIPTIALGQSEHRPKYGPRKDKHRNKTDELDRKQGLWKHYNYLGTLIMEVEYLDDRRHGMSRRYYGNGRIMRETEFIYGVKDGPFKRFNFDGIVEEGDYSEGKKVGLWTNYFSDGQIRKTGPYDKGKKEGEWNYYNRKGKLINHIVFHEGKDLRVIMEAKKKAEEEKKAAELKEKGKSKRVYRVRKR